MNQQIKTGLGVAVILIFAVTAGAFVWVAQKNIKTVESVPAQINHQIKKNSEKTEINVINKEGTVYTNSDYGFQLTLPKGYQDFITDKETTEYFVGDIKVKTDEITFYFKSRPGYENDSSKIKGYENIFSVVIWSQSEWNKIASLTESKCVPLCPLNFKLGESNRRAYTISFGNSYDGMNINFSNLTKILGVEQKNTGTVATEALSFKIIQQNEVVADWQTSLKDIVSSMVDKKTNGLWDKKVEITSINATQKAVIGKWWAKDAWDWIAWQKTDGNWSILISMDGFICKDLDNMPVQYNNFFHDAIYLKTAKGEQKQCS